MSVTHLSAIGILAVVALSAPLWLFALGVLLYAVLIGSPYVPLIIAICIDAQFGDGERGFAYLYTATSAAVLILVAVVRPYMHIELSE